MAQTETFSIRQMIELTGLSEFTIRGWENRYCAFQPRRSKTGRREYLKNDVERALLLRELLKRGLKIGKIAPLSNASLKALLAATPAPQALNAVRTAHTTHTAPPAVTRTLELLAVQNWRELELHIQKQTFPSASQFVHGFFVPLMQSLANHVGQGLISVAQEHFLSSLIKEKIYFEISKLKASKKTGRAAKTRFVLATPEGDHHELGLLAAHLLVRSHRGTSLYLGPNTPSNEIAETALRFSASHILIVTTISKRSGAAKEPLTFLSELRRNVGPKVKILVAGQQAPMNVPSSTGIFRLRSFEALEEVLS